MKPEQTTLGGFSGFEGVAKKVHRSPTTLQSMCVHCGREKWLKWVVDGKYVCDDCKKDLMER